jgi:CHAT domain-containing protein/tetratricopeptide (TPR) repeat protein
VPVAAVPVVTLAFALAVSTTSGAAGGAGAQLRLANAAAAAGRPVEALARFEHAAVLARARSDRRDEAAALAGRGEAQETLGRFESALESAQSARSLHLALGDRTRAAADLVDCGIAREDLNRYAAALADEQRALAEARAAHDRRDEAAALGAIGVAAMREGRIATALAADQASLRLDRSVGNRVGEGDELGRVGLVDDVLGRYGDALREFARALAVHRAIANRRGEAKTLNNLGIVEEHMGRYAAALRSHEQALPLFRAIGNRLGEASDEDNIGIVDEDLGRYLPALAAHESALSVFRALGNAAGEAADLANTAIVDTDLGRYDEALHDLDRALALDRRIDNPSGVADALESVGVVYEDLGRYEDALGEFQEALALHRKLGNPRGQAGDLGNIGVVLAELDRAGDAVDAESDAFELDRKLDDPAGEAADLNNVGNVLERAGRNAEALRAHRRALALDRAAGNRLQASQDLSNIGNEENLLGRSAEALAAARDALHGELGLDAPEAVWRALRVAARAEARLGRRDDALADYDAALGRIEALRASLEAGSERRSFFENKLFVYDEYLDYLRELDGRYPGRGYDRKALDVFEREQGRAFLEEIGQSSARTFSGVPPEVTARESELAAQTERVQTLLAKSRSAAVDGAAVSALAGELADLLRSRAALESRLRVAYPAYFALTHPQPRDPATLQRLLAPGEVALVYAVLDDATALWVIDRSHLSLYSLTGGTRDVSAKVQAVLRGPQAMQDDLDHSITNPHILTERAAQLAPQVASDAYALYTWLVPPAARASVEAGSHLLVVPTGPLYQLAFEALVTRDPASEPEPHFLIEDRAVSYLSSASLLAVLRAAEAARRAPRYPVVAFADPAYAQPGQASADEDRSAVAKLQTNVLASYFGPRDYFPELPGSETEAKAVVAALDAPADSRPLYEGEDASRDNVLQLQAADCDKAPCLRDYRYLLFATHAVLPDQVEGLAQPSLVLAHPESGAGFLTMGDVLGLSLDADVVSLSACNTGRGTASHGDGVRGLTQAFMYAGTPVVSVTLWDLSDLAAAHLTPAFYAGLKAGKSPAEALRDAKLALLHGDDAILRFPYFWASTVIFGDGGMAAERG